MSYSASLGLCGDDSDWRARGVCGSSERPRGGEVLCSVTDGEFQVLGGGVLRRRRETIEQQLSAKEPVFRYRWEHPSLSVPRQIVRYKMQGQNVI